MPKPYDRMYVYLWSEDDQECKFGQRFVVAGKEPQTDCEARIRSSLGVRKDKFPEVKTRGVQIWDVSKYAKDLGIFHNKAKVDDNIRKHIGFRKGTVGEVHTIPQDLMFMKVTDFLRRGDQPLLVAGLSTGQFDAAVETVDAFNSGDKIILAELCARFGKTIWSSAVATEVGAELVVVASYVKTVFTSFTNDIIKYEQFREYDHIDTGEAGYEEKIAASFAAGKKVFAYLSLCVGSKRQDRIDYLFSLPQSRFLIVDEADFGAHKVGQADPLRAALQSEDRVVLMTGTNADRAATGWKIDHIVTTNYFELLTHKADALAELNG